MKKLKCLALITLAAAIVGCQDSNTDIDPVTPEELPEWYYTGGELGTTHLNTFNAFEQPTANIESNEIGRASCRERVCLYV